MPRKSKDESYMSWDMSNPEEWKNKFKGKMWMHSPWMMGMGGCGCGWYHKGRGLGAFILAGSVLWILSIMGTIPASVPAWLEFLAALGFAATFN